MSDMREHLADLCHQQWAGWMEYLFSKCHEGSAVTIPQGLVARWDRQMHTPYAALPDDEKASDRKAADRFLELLRAELAALGWRPLENQPFLEAIATEACAINGCQNRRSDGGFRGVLCAPCAGEDWLKCRARALTADKLVVGAKADAEAAWATAREADKARMKVEDQLAEAVAERDFLRDVVSKDEAKDIAGARALKRMIVMTRAEELREAAKEYRHFNRSVDGDPRQHAVECAALYLEDRAKMWEQRDSSQP